MDEEADSVHTEMLALQSIFNNDLEVIEDNGEITEVIAKITPKVGDSDTEKYVKLSLVFKLPKNYPYEIPSFEIKSARGLSDNLLNRIDLNLKEVAQSSLGEVMLYKLIDTAQDIVSDSNIPSGSCSICLYDFHAEDQFSATSCFHYFHDYCIADHVHHVIKQYEKTLKENRDPLKPIPKLIVECPICRLGLNFQPWLNKVFPKPIESLQDTDIVLQKDMKKIQKEMKTLTLHRQNKEGIIDVEAERNRFLIHTNPSSIDTTDSSISNNQQPGESKYYRTHFSNGDPVRGRPKYNNYNRYDRRPHHKEGPPEALFKSEGQVSSHHSRSNQGSYSSSHEPHYNNRDYNRPRQYKNYQSKNHQFRNTSENNSASDEASSNIQNNLLANKRQQPSRTNHQTSNGNFYRNKSQQPSDSNPPSQPSEVNKSHGRPRNEFSRPERSQNKTNRGEHSAVKNISHNNRQTENKPPESSTAANAHTNSNHSSSSYKAYYKPKKPDATKNTQNNPITESIRPPPGFEGCKKSQVTTTQVTRPPPGFAKK